MLRPLSLVLLAALAAGGAIAATPVPRADARGAVARPDSVRTRSLAVLYFDNNTGDAQYDALGRGMASMMITDISAVPEIRIVERERLQHVLEEQRMQQSTMFDPSTAVKTGKLLGAEYLVTGAFSAVKPVLRIDTRVIRVETGEIVKSTKVTGLEDRFFELQQRLAKDLVAALPVAVSPEAMERLRERQQRNRIDNVNTMIAFSQAVARYDGGDYVGAAARMQPVLRDAPDALVVKLFSDEVKRRSGNVAKRKIREGLKGWLGSRP